MALRSCTRFVRSAAVNSKIVSDRLETTLRYLQPGNAVCPGRADGRLLSPVRFISSDALLSRLMKGKSAESKTCSVQLPISVPIQSAAQISLLMQPPDQPENPKVLKVAIIGAANAGKSTLSNQLLGLKLFAASKKVHTTRTSAMGVLTENDTQIILLDTPGLTTRFKVKRHHLEESLLIDPWNTVKEADLVVVLVDVSDRWMCGQLDFEVLKCLAQHPDIPAVLVLNKVDRIKSKDRLLDITSVLSCGIINGHKIRVRPVFRPRAKKKEKSPELPRVLDNMEELDTTYQGENRLSKEQLKELSQQRGWPHFKDVFMLSSLDREDVDTLKSYLLVNAKPGEWQYHSEVLTDQSPEQICINILREKLLEHLPEEVPYSFTQSVELWHEKENGDLDITVKLHAKKEGHVSLAIGPAGEKVARMAREMSEDLSNIFVAEVRVKLIVKLKK